MPAEKNEIWRAHTISLRAARICRRPLLNWRDGAESVTPMIRRLFENSPAYILRRLAAKPEGGCKTCKRAVELDRANLQTFLSWQHRSRSVTNHWGRSCDSIAALDRALAFVHDKVKIETRDVVNRYVWCERRQPGPLHQRIDSIHSRKGPGRARIAPREDVWFALRLAERDPAAAAARTRSRWAGATNQLGRIHDLYEPQILGKGCWQRTGPKMRKSAPLV